jgi:aspartate/methionine/tyrosine aminotransferase
MRKYNLSFSGLQYSWDFETYLATNLKDVGYHHISEFPNPEQMVAQRYAISPHKIAITHGATQALNIALLACLEPTTNGQRNIVAVESPAYAPVVQTPLLLNCDTIPVQRYPPVDGFGPWRINKKEWLDVLQQSKVLMITPQLNPCGWDYESSDRRWIIDTCKKLAIKIISDEVYIDSMKGTEDYKPFHLEGEHCISINSLTKIYGLGPLRFGWIIANKEIISNAKRAFLTFSGMMASPTIRLASAVFPHLDLALEKIKQYREINLPVLREMLERQNIVWNEPPHVVFGAFQLPNGFDSMTFVDEACAEHSVLAVPGSMFSRELSGWLRVAWSIEPVLFSEAIINLEKALISIN